MTAPSVVRSRPVAAGLAAALVLAGATAVGATTLRGGPAAAEPTPAAAEPGRGLGVDVGGEATASGTPDVLRFTVGVGARAADVDAAVSSANASAAKVVASLAARRVAKRDTQTAVLQISPQYDRKGRVITGYVVREDLRVTVRDLKTAGATISAAVAAGGNAARLSGVVFALEEDDALRTAARDEAYAEARAKAEQYARLSGRRLGDVVSIEEDVRQTPSDPYLSASYDTAAARSAVPIEAGSTEVRVTVQVRWALR